MFKLCVFALVCLSGINAASIAGTFDEIPAASVLPEFVAGDLAKPAPAPAASVLPEFSAVDLIKPAPAVIPEASVLPEISVGDLVKPAVPEASVFPGDLIKPAPIVEAACESDNIPEEIIAIPELEIQLPIAPEVIETPELENPCGAVEEEVSPVAPEIEVILPESPVVRPLPEEEEVSVISPEIEVIVPEVGCAAVEEEVVAEAPIASILPAPAVVDPSQLISAFPAKFE